MDRRGFGVFFYPMLSVFQSCAIILASIAMAVVCLLIFRRRVLRGRQHSQHNDIVGWQIAFLGTTYAVIIAFMLSDVWNNFREAERNAESEANAVLDLYRVAPGLPQPQSAEVASETRRYVEVMIGEEWPAMERGTFSDEGFAIVISLWKAVTGVRVTNASEQTLLQQALTDLASMSEHRRIRHLESRSKLPSVFWLLLIVGGVLTVTYTCLFDVEETRMHLLQVIGVTFIVSLVLVAIGDVDAPFGGALKIEPTGFRMALQSMDKGK